MCFHFLFLLLLAKLYLLLKQFNLDLPTHQNYLFSSVQTLSFPPDPGLTFVLNISCALADALLVVQP